MKTVLWNVTQGLVIDWTVVSMIMNTIIALVVENIWSTWVLLNEKGVFHIDLIVCQSTMCEFNSPALIIRPISVVNNNISVCTVLCCTRSTECAAYSILLPLCRVAMAFGMMCNCTGWVAGYTWNPCSQYFVLFLITCVNLNLYLSVISSLQF
jgi:hypothetical protein